jgi:Mg/Co/Ni transporter MgtE
MGKQNYIIDDLEEFTRSARKLVFNGFDKSIGDDPDEFTKLITEISQDDLEEMDQILTQQESLVIVKSLAKEQKHKITNESRYLIDEKIFSQIIEEMNGRLVSNMLSSLASKGMIESAYDEQINDFIFWIKDDETPETD